MWICYVYDRVWYEDVLDCELFNILAHVVTCLEPLHARQSIEKGKPPPIIANIASRHLIIRGYTIVNDDVTKNLVTECLEPGAYLKPAASHVGLSEPPCIFF